LKTCQSLLGGKIPTVKPLFKDQSWDNPQVIWFYIGQKWDKSGKRAEIIYPLVAFTPWDNGCYPMGSQIRSRSAGTSLPLERHLHFLLLDS
jgi:hypothetical protein